MIRIYYILSISPLMSINVSVHLVSLCCMVYEHTHMFSTLLRTVNFLHVLGTDYTKCSVYHCLCFSLPDQKWQKLWNFIFRRKRLT
jgi:hypothetical protein